MLSQVSNGSKCPVPSHVSWGSDDRQGIKENPPALGDGFGSKLLCRLSALSDHTISEVRIIPELRQATPKAFHGIAAHVVDPVSAIGLES